MHTHTHTHTQLRMIILGVSHNVRSIDHLLTAATLSLSLLQIYMDTNDPGVSLASISKYLYAFRFSFDHAFS